MKKDFRVNLTASAEADIGAIWEYIAQDSPANAAGFLDELEERVMSLSRLPERGPVIPEGLLLQTSNYHHIIHKNYRIVYRIENGQVYVLRIFHGSKLLDVAELDM